jgi:hypothetical protein
MKPRLDLLGERFGRLVVLELARRHQYQGGHTSLFWRCRCDCGQIREVTTCHLRNGRTLSCGCLNRERNIARSTKHGFLVGRGKLRPPELNIYYAARQRCTNPHNKDYKDYGGRGIEFRFQSFEKFLEEVGPRPSPELTLDRRDVNGHYECGNLRWATPTEQAHNRRRRYDSATTEF